MWWKDWLTPKTRKLKKRTPSSSCQVIFAGVMDGYLSTSVRITTRLHVVRAATARSVLISTRCVRILGQLAQHSFNVSKDR